jgi:hypothetical protein
MTFAEIAASLGIREYPGELNEIYAKMSQTNVPACDLSLIDSLQEKYNFFADLYDVVRENAVAVNTNAACSTWIKVATSYAKQVDIKAAKALPVPQPDGTVFTQMLPYYIVLGQIPDALAKYLACGFEETEVLGLFATFRGSLRKVEKLTGIIGLNQTYYSWLNNFTKAVIFKTEGFQFEIKEFPKTVLYLRNRETGKLLPMRLSGLICVGGEQPVGSYGYADESGAFTPTFSEDEENYYGHGVFDNIVDSEKNAYPKTKWECVVRPGDNCLSIHIPSGTDISTEATMRACKSAVKIVRKFNPEKASNVIYGSSWILNPKLKDMLGENARISQFLECFTKYPMQDANGNAVFNFVFSGRPENLKELPEETSLQRKIKALYLSGGCLHKYSGVIYIEEE